MSRDMPVAAERVHERAGQRRHHGRERHADGERQPQRLRAEGRGVGVASRRRAAA